ncbi:MAG: hypothetical protein ACKV2V_22330 [Blastocatellia bacterium]
MPRIRRSACHVSFALPLICLFLLAGAPVRAQHIEVDHAETLARLRETLHIHDGFRQADALAVLGENALSTLLNELTGLEIRLSTGTVLQISSTALRMDTGLARVEFGVRVRPGLPLAIPVSLRLLGELGSGEITGTGLRLPFRFTEVKSDSLPTTLLTTVFRQWLQPERWNESLPPLELPLNLEDSLDIPATRFEAAGSPPMEIATPPFKLRLHLVPVSFMFLRGRAVVALYLAANPAHTVSWTPIPGQARDAAAIANEIESLAAHLPGGPDVRFRLSHNTVNSLLTQAATAGPVDMTVRLRPGRVREEHVERVISVHNYTDVESGEGNADLQEMHVEAAAGSRLNVRLTAAGTLAARLRGREYGVPFSLSPHGAFNINNELLMLETVHDARTVYLRAVPGSQIPVRVALRFSVLGRTMQLPQTMRLQADQLFGNLALPDFLSREIALPRRIEASEKDGARISASVNRRYGITGLRVNGDNAGIELTARLAVPE